LVWPECQNTRDLGGLPLRGGLTRSRVLIRSDNVGHLNALGREAMKAYGVATVLDLRSESETLSTPSPFVDGTAIAYLHRELIDDANMTQIGDSMDLFERYMTIVNRRPQAFREIFETIADTDGCILFHCFAGKDRTGIVAAMLLALAGVSDDDIGADYAETDLSLAKQYEIWIGEAPPDRQDAFRAELRCPPERILGVLDAMRRRWGGVEGYLESAGTSPMAIERLKARLA
jgi:protein-tyrosine phosphatase